MRIDEQILKRLKEMVKGPELVFPAVVTEVDRENLTCTVIPPDGVELPEVRLKAGIDGLAEGIVEIPSLNSSVLVALIGNTEENAFVAKCSEVEEVLFYGGAHGGLIKVNELLSELQKINDLLEAMKSTFASWVPVPNDGGAKLKADMNTALGQKVLPDYSNIENPKVKH